jgi:hypothetical protein
MKPTKLSTLILSALAVSGVGFVVVKQLVASGVALPVSQLPTLLIQPAIVIILIASAIPMMRYRSSLKKFIDGKGARPKLVDPAYAVRTVALAKAISLTGSLFTGWHIAIITYRLSTPSDSSIASMIFALVGSLALAISGVVIENLFRVPPDQDGDAA